MFMEDHSTYVLLASIPRDQNPICNKACILLMLFVTMPIAIYSLTYINSLDPYDDMSFPETYSLKTVPQQWIHRAIMYNNYTENDMKDTRIIKKTHESYHSNTLTQYKLVCYYNFPNQDVDALKPGQIDPFLCTHINLAFATIQNNSLYLDATQLKTVQAVVDLKKTNLNLKILLSVGGAGNNDGFPQMVLNHTNRKIFIKSVLNYVINYKIDGIDLDWEFPNESQDGDKYQRMHFTQLLEEFRHSINRQINHKYILSVAVAAPQFLIDVSYDPIYINEYVDFINVMTYDYHFFTRTTPFTGINAPLYPTNNEKKYLSSLNINFTATYWHFKGVDKNKINIGLPTYGHSFKLVNFDNNGIYAPAEGYGKLGTNGFADYMQICTFLNQNQITPIFDMDSKSPYATKLKQWVSFDDEQSLSYKTEYIRENNYGGAMVYALNTDDYKGICTSCVGKHFTECKKSFPLTNVIKKTLNEKYF